jgi:glycosyltransferase involved in cell wall biosynthesis
MIVGFFNRPKDLWVGGDYVQLEKTAEALRKLGVEVRIFEHPLPPPKEIQALDIIHYWNFSMEWSKYAVWLGVKYKKPLVASMIYHESEHYIPYANQQLMLDNTHPIFLCEGEKERVKRHLKVKKSSIIPNGIDKEWFKPTREKVPVTDYVLTVGRLDGTKGQLETAQACKELGLTYVMIGEDFDTEYTETCKLLGAIHLGKMTREELKKWYKHASLYVLMSKKELMPLTVMEAGAFKKNIVLTDKCEYQFPNVKYSNTEDLRENIMRALLLEKNETLYKFVKSQTWDDVALSIKHIYDGLRKK